MMKNLYGSGLPARMAIEKQILGRCVALWEPAACETITARHARGCCCKQTNNHHALDANVRSAVAFVHYM